MNVKLKVLTAAVLAGFMGSAAAQPIPGTPPPPVIAGGVVPGTAGAPKLSAPEEGAYTVIESVLEAVEASIYANSCKALAGTHLLSVYTDSKGEGSAELITPGSSLELDVDLDDSNKLLGTHYDVDAGYNTSIAGGKEIRDFDGDGFFDAKGGIMVHEGEFRVNFPATNNNVSVQSRVIKDFRWVKGVFYDYGLQSLAKKGPLDMERAAYMKKPGQRYDSVFYPQAKYWQTSKHIKSNGVEGVTLINKQRLYNANGNTPCSIVVNIHGDDTYDGFDQSGTLTVKTAAP
jgi:hypothetical protein